MSQSVRFRAEAAEDVAEASSWYEGQRVGLGRQFESALDSAVALLSELPEAGPVVYRTVRRILLRRFPYAVYYTVSRDLVEIRAVSHMHRDARRWKRRE